jgi:hypothetical protein
MDGHDVEDHAIGAIVMEQRRSEQGGRPVV